MLTIYHLTTLWWWRHCMTSQVRLSIRKLQENSGVFSQSLCKTSSLSWSYNEAVSLPSYLLIFYIVPSRELRSRIKTPGGFAFVIKWHKCNKWQTLFDEMPDYDRLYLYFSLKVAIAAACFWITNCAMI